VVIDRRRPPGCAPIAINGGNGSGGGHASDGRYIDLVELDWNGSGVLPEGPTLMAEVSLLSLAWVLACRGIHVIHLFSASKRHRPGRAWLRRPPTPTR